MQTMLITAALSAVEIHHRFGHTCQDGQWYNPNAGTRTPCHPLEAVRLAQTQVTEVTQAVHTAAHTDHTALLVGAASAGFDASDLDAFTDDDRRGLTMMGRRAIEALAALLEP